MTTPPFAWPAIYRGAQPARPFHSKQTLLKSIALFFFSKWRTDRTRRRDFCGRYTKSVSPHICPGATVLFISDHFEPFSIHSCTSSILSDLRMKQLRFSPQIRYYVTNFEAEMFQSRSTVNCFAYMDVLFTILDVFAANATGAWFILLILNLVCVHIRK